MKMQDMVANPIYNYNGITKMAQWDKKLKTD